MKTLPSITATPEQLPIISANRLGVEVIRGAAGSGKTSTALLRLRSLAYMFEERHERANDPFPVQILVLTFNRTLRGYVSALVSEQLISASKSFLTIETFASWAMPHIGRPAIIDDRPREVKIKQLGSRLTGITPDYTVKEVDYLLGKYLPQDLEQYIEQERTGRGLQPRVDRILRRRLLDEVVYPYNRWLAEQGLVDWNGVAVAMIDARPSTAYEVVIIDETQDFSANQLRAIRGHIADEHAITFVIDTVQRIYARGFTWTETGFDMTGARYHSLKSNHRNSKQIAAFTAGLLRGISVEDDGTLPDLASAQRAGPSPSVLKGFYGNQVDWAIKYIKKHIDLNEKSVAFLKPQGGGYFKELKSRLDAAGMRYEDITREDKWPDNDVNIALSTFHSAKGLEFDYVFILGLGEINTTHGKENEDDQLTVLRRLLAVAVARARDGVTLGYKPGEESALVQFFEPGTFTEIVV